MELNKCDKCKKPISYAYRYCLNCFREIVEQMSQTELVNRFGNQIDRKNTPFWKGVFRYIYKCQECGCSYGARRAYHGNNSRCLACRECHNSNYTPIERSMGVCDNCSEESSPEYRFCTNCYLTKVKDMPLSDVVEIFGKSVDKRTSIFWLKVFPYRYQCMWCYKMFGTREPNYDINKFCLQCKLDNENNTDSEDDFSENDSVLS